MLKFVSTDMIYNLLINNVFLKHLYDKKMQKSLVREFPIFRIALLKADCKVLLQNIFNFGSGKF